jgi:hypothetical protein
VEPNSVKSVFSGSHIGAKSIQIVGAPCVLKGVRYGPGETTTKRFNYFELYDGGTVNGSAVVSGGLKICNLYAGITLTSNTYFRAGSNEPLAYNFPGLGIRFSTAFNISIPANSRIEDLMLIYQT